MGRDINENTRVPLRVIWYAGGALMGGVIWATTLYISVSDAQTDLSVAKAKIEEFTKVLERIDRRLARIEGQIGVKPRKEDE